MPVDVPQLLAAHPARLHHFAQAIEMLHRWDAWDAVPASVRAHLTRADPAQETVKARSLSGLTLPFMV